MRSWFSKGLIGAAIMLPTLSTAAWADCSDATLIGEYAFGVTAYTPPPGGPTTQVVTGIKVFDGQGHFTQRDYQGDTLRTRGTSDFTTGETGTYTVNPDCTGTGIITLPFGNPEGKIWFNFVISDGGRHIHEVVSEFEPPGVGFAVPTQTSADDWKVAPEGGTQ